MGLKLRCVKKKIMPFEWTMWVYAGADLHFMKNDEVLTYTQTYIVKMILEAIEVLK